MQDKAGPSETVVEHMIASIREAIRQGDFAPGQRLVVADISKMFGVSVGPAREAIRRLTGEGFLEFTPHKGAMVRTYGERDVRETFQAREAVEGYVARLAAENIHHGDYADRLRACLVRIRAACNMGLESFTEARQEYHEVLYAIAGNAVLTDVATRLTYPFDRLRYSRATGQARADQSMQEHEDIVAAILAGDSARAELLTRIHLRNGALAVVEVMARGPLATVTRLSRERS